MRKLLFLSFALVCALSGNAQKVVLKDGRITKQQIVDLPNQKMERSADVKRVGPNRTVANSVYYTMPGALFAGWDTEGSGYIYSMAEVPPFVDVTFANQMTDKSRYNWQIIGSAGETDITEYAEENGDYVSNYTPQGLFYTPVLISPRANVVYQFNEDNYWVKTNGSYTTNDLSLMMTYSQVNDDVLMMTATDLHGSRLSGNNYARNTLSGWGYLSTDFLFGSGDVDGSPAFGFEQTYNPLLAPLALNDVRLQALTYNEYGPIPDGKSLKAYVLTIDTVTDETTLVATLEALASDTIDFKDSSPKWGNSGENANKTAYFGELIFRNTEKFVDPFGNETPLPVAVPAGQVWRIQFEGLNDEGVNLGVFGVIDSEVEATYIEPGYILTEDGHAYTFQSHICPYISLNAQYEMIDVVKKNFLTAETTEDFPAANFQGWNVLRVSDNGEEIFTEGMTGTNYDMGCAFVGTSIPWFDEDGFPNYDIDIDNLPDWIESLQVDTTEYNKDNISGYNLVIPVCKPLPAGVTGRKAELDIIGSAGISGNNKIIVLQGDATYDEDGIVEVNKEARPSKSSKLYNLAGQRISTPVNGQIYIKNGRKFTKK